MRKPYPTTGRELSRRWLLGAGAASLAGGNALAARRIVIDLDMREAPQLQSWAEEARRRAYVWWSVIDDELFVPGYAPARHLTLTFSNDMPEKIAGHAVHDKIFLNAPYIAEHPSYYNYIAHEMVHVYQGYPPPIDSWLTEGIADYVRYYVLFPQDPERLFDVQGSDYRLGYQPAAALLDWVERTHGIGSVRQVNASLHRGGDGEAVLERLAGMPLDQVWARVLDAFSNGFPVPQA